jgi:hypothetical protein
MAQINGGLPPGEISQAEKRKLMKDVREEMKPMIN